MDREGRQDQNMSYDKVKLPLISIVTPSYNQGEFIEECIDSILSQNYPNLEYVIMDGGSSDNSVDIIKKYEKYLAYWQSKPDGGQYAAVNDGFKKTTGAIMAWLNSDDKYHREAFFKVAAFFDQLKEAEWITGRPVIWGKGGEATSVEPTLPTYGRKSFLEGKYNRPFIQQESTFWKRSLWDRAGGYVNRNLGFAGDLELWVRFFRYSVLFSVDTFLGGYRSHGNQKAIMYMDKYIAEAETILAEELKLQGNGYILMSPEPPMPVHLDCKGFLNYLNQLDIVQLCASPQQMVAGEQAIQLLLGSLDVLQSELSCQRTQIEALVACQEEIGALRSSTSWRITKFLRWLGDNFRGIVKCK